MEDPAARLVRRFVAATAPWLLDDDRASTDHLADAWRPPRADEAAGADGAPRARAAGATAVDAHPLPDEDAFAALPDNLGPALGLDDVERAVLGAFFAVEESWDAYRWLGQLGVSGVTTRGERALSLRMITTALASRRRPASAVRAALERLSRRGLLAPGGDTSLRRRAASASSLYLPLAVRRFAAARREPPAAPHELAPGLWHHPAERDPDLVGAVLAAFPAAAGARFLVAGDLPRDDAALLAGALAATPFLTVDLARADRRTVRLAFTLAAVADGLLFVQARDRLDALAGPEAERAARAREVDERLELLTDARERGAPRWLVHLAPEAEVPSALASAARLSIATADEDAAGALLARRRPEVALALSVARRGGGRLGASLAVAATALRSPELVAAVERAAGRRMVEAAGLRPLVAPEPDDVLGAAARAPFAETIAHIRARARIPASYQRLLPSGVVARVSSDDPGLERAALAWLGREVGRPVVRMEAASIVSRYIGEAEANLRRQMDAAEHLDAVLYLPAAETLLGRRVAASSSGDRHANRQINYLLQLLETYRGVFVFSTTRAHELDPALQRRVLYQIELPPLDAAARARLLDRLLPPAPRRGADLDPAAALGRARLDVDALHRAVLDALVLAHAAGRPVAQADLLGALASGVSRG